MTFLLCGGTESSYAKGWRGLVPLRSTRSDVVRLLNQCADQKQACRFTIGTEDVHILFSDGAPPEYACVKRLPTETIMFIAVEPRVKLKLSDLRLEKRKLQTFNPSESRDRRFKGYRSTDGLVLSLFRDEIIRIFYLADQSDTNRCEEYYRHPESFVLIPLVHVQVINAINAPESIKAGEILKVIADSNLNAILGYTWTLSAGRIITGQYTKEITVDTTGLAGQELVITAEIGDGLGHLVSSSCVVRVLPGQVRSYIRNDKGFHRRASEIVKASERGALRNDELSHP